MTINNALIKAWASAQDTGRASEVALNFIDDPSARVMSKNINSVSEVLRVLKTRDRNADRAGKEINGAKSLIAQLCLLPTDTDIEIAVMDSATQLATFLG